MTQQQQKILIIDDHLLFADGLQLLLSQLLQGVQVSSTTSAQDVLLNPKELNDKDLVIIDLHMPKFTGFSFLQAMQEARHKVPILVISGVENRSEIEHALALGAQGFVPKDASGEEMLRGVERVIAGGKYLPEHWAGKVDWPMAKPNLRSDLANVSGCPDEIGPRQLQVLKLLEDGLQNKQIALVLGVSVSTVKSHTQLLYRALNVTNRTAAIKAANAIGLLHH